MEHISYYMHASRFKKKRNKKKLRSYPNLSDTLRAFPHQSPALWLAWSGNSNRLNTAGRKDIFVKTLMTKSFQSGLWTSGLYLTTCYLLSATACSLHVLLSHHRHQILRVDTHSALSNNSTLHALGRSVGTLQGRTQGPGLEVLLVVFPVFLTPLPLAAPAMYLPFL